MPFLWESKSQSPSAERPCLQHYVTDRELPRTSQRETKRITVLRTVHQARSRENSGRGEPVARLFDVVQPVYRAESIYKRAGSTVLSYYGLEIKALLPKQ